MEGEGALRQGPRGTGPSGKGDRLGEDPCGGSAGKPGQRGRRVVVQTPGLQVYPGPWRASSPGLVDPWPLREL